ncbi:MAG: YbhB/YbcL family Raf kinase inhibitor-like protein [Planctomycetota bacterium]|nr:YbhB/YbcL family Raf kinase inhibitor-like protein [Planctomycetota bacterium]
MRYRMLPFMTIVAAGLCGCEQAGTDEPQPATQPAAPAEPAASEPAQTPERKEGEVMATLEVTSPSFAHEGPIPMEFTCDGADVSPALSWTAGPDGTAGYALIMDDPDAPREEPWVHWVAWNIPEPSLVDAIPARETLDDGMRQGMNTWPKLGYRGPCPPGGTHRYYFKVYALDTTLDLPSSTDKDALFQAMEGHILAEGVLMGTYQRQ